MTNFALLSLIFLMFLACERRADIHLNFGVSAPSSPSSLSVTINQAINEIVGTCNFTAPSDPSYDQNFEYRVTFSSPIDHTTFTSADISNEGTGGGSALNWTIENCGDDTNFKLTASGIIGDGTIVPKLISGSVSASDGINNAASTATDNSVTYLKGWYQEAYIKASNNDANDNFGRSVSISGDTLAVGAQYEDSNQTTITNATTASTNNSNSDSGAVYVYRRSGVTWAQEAYIKASNNNTNDNFGRSVSISGDTLAVGAPSEDSNQTTITNGATASSNNSNVDSGAVYVYRRSGVTWAQEAYIKASNNNTNDYFGNSVSISGDTLAVGASNEDSNQTTITNGTTASSDNSDSNSGAVYVYRRSGVAWAQEAYIKPPNYSVNDFFGISVSISGDTLSVGAYFEDSNQTTITNGTAGSYDNSNSDSGAVYVYRRSGVTWVQEAYIKASNNDAGDRFGEYLSISGDTLAIGTYFEDSNQTTITNGTTGSNDNSNSDSGAVYVYRRSGATWAQEAYIKASNNDAGDYFGISISISGDTLAVGAIAESSNQITITNGSTASGDNSNSISGAAYVYRRSGTTWAQEAYIKATNNDANDYFGASISISGDTLAVGAILEDSNQTTITNGPTASTDNSNLNSGAVYVYRNRSRLFEVAELGASSTSNSVTLDWTKSGGSATQFFVTYQSGAVAPADCTLGTVVNAGDVSTFTELALSNNTTYSFRVCASDGANLTDGVTVSIQTLP